MLERVYTFFSNNTFLNLSFSQNINELPSLNLTIDNSNVFLPSNTFPVSFSTDFLKVEGFFDIINQRWDGKLTLELSYAKDITFSPRKTSPSVTLCNISLTSIHNYFLTIYNCWSNYFSSIQFSNNGKIFRFDPVNMSFVDWLNYLGEFGYYWYVDWTSQVKPALVIRHYTNQTASGVILGGKSISIDNVILPYNSIQIVKETYDDNIPREITITGENPCIELDFEIDPSGIIIVGSSSDVGVLFFNETGDKIWGCQFVQLNSCQSRVFTDCKKQYSHTISQNCSNPCFACGSNYHCGKIKIGVGSVGCQDSPNTSNCVKQIRMYKQGCTFEDNLLPTDYVTLRFDLSKLCSSSALDCIVTNDFDSNFDKKLLVHTININKPSFCNTSPYEIRIANIDASLWNTVINFHTNITAKHKRIIKISNPITNDILQVGKWYNVIIGDQSLLCLLTSLFLEADYKSFSVEVTLENYV